jgi:hypothetical protein
LKKLKPNTNFLELKVSSGIVAVNKKDKKLEIITVRSLILRGREEFLA